MRSSAFDLKQVIPIILAATTLAILTGCFDENAPNSLPPTNGFALGNVDIVDLEGVWEATEVRFTSSDAPVQEKEIISLGGSGTLQVDPAGRFALIIVIDQGGGVLSGEFSVENGVFTAVFDDEPDRVNAWVAQASESRLLLQGPVFYDLENKGSRQWVQLKLSLVRK